MVFSQTPLHATSTNPVRKYSLLSGMITCAITLWFHHVQNHAPDWDSILSICGLVFCISLFIGYYVSCLVAKASFVNNHLAKRFFILWLILYPLILFGQQYLKYQSYSSEVWDLGTISQAFASTARGHFFSTILPGTDISLSMFSQHTELVFILLYPFFRLFPHPLTLVAAQSICMAFSVYGIFCLANHILGRYKTSLAIAFCFSLFPACYYCGLLDVHADVFAMLPLIYMILFSVQNKYKAAIGCFLAALFCKEYVALAGLSFGIYLLLQHKKYRLGLLMAGISVLWFSAAILSQSLIRPAAIPSLFSELYAYSASGSNLFFLQTNWHKALTPSNIHNLLFLFVPCLFLCFGYPFVLLFLLPFLLKDMPVGLSIESHRLAPFLVLLWYSIIQSLKRIDNTRPRSLPKTVTALIIAVLACSFVFSEAPWSQRFLRSWHWRYNNTERILALDDLVKKIPKDAAVSVSADIFPHCINRSFLYLFPAPLNHDKTDFIALNLYRISEHDRTIVDSLAASPDWKIRSNRNQAVLLQRISH